MKAFRDYLREQFKDKKVEKKFYKRLEKERISAELLYYREKFSLTQEELAKKVNTSQSAIARLEDSDYRGYSIKVLRKIADALGLELVVTFREKEKLEYEEVPAQIFYPSVQTQQISSQLFAVDDSKLRYVYTTAVGIETTALPLTLPITIPNKGERATA